MEVGVVKDLGIAATNSEFADLDNPHGYIYRNHYWIQAVQDDGRRYDHFYITFDKVKADALVARIQDALDGGGVLNLEDTDVWREGSPVYGSRAYQNDDCEGQHCEREWLDDSYR